MKGRARFEALEAQKSPMLLLLAAHRRTARANKGEWEMLQCTEKIWSAVFVWLWQWTVNGAKAPPRALDLRENPS
jgi:hypothetical protein